MCFGWADRNTGRGSGMQELFKESCKQADEMTDSHDRRRERDYSFFSFFKEGLLVSSVELDFIDLTENSVSNRR